MLMTPPHRAVNTKTYLVSWPEANSKMVEPLTTCTDGQRVELYLVREGVSLKVDCRKPAALTQSRSRAVVPCATGVEEFLWVLQRERSPE